MGPRLERCLHGTFVPRGDVHVARDPRGDRLGRNLAPGELLGLPRDIGIVRFGRDMALAPHHIQDAIVGLATFVAGVLAVQGAVGDLLLAEGAARHVIRSTFGGAGAIDAALNVREVVGALHRGDSTEGPARTWQGDGFTVRGGETNGQEERLAPHCP